MCWGTITTSTKINRKCTWPRWYTRYFVYPGTGVPAHHTPAHTVLNHTAAADKNVSYSVRQGNHTLTFLCRSMSALFSRKLSSLRDTRPSGRSESREWNRRTGVASSSRFGRVGARVLGKNQIGSGALGAGPRAGAADFASRVSPDFEAFVQTHKKAGHTYCPGSSAGVPCIEAMRR